MIKKDIFNKNLKKRLLASAGDRVYNFLLANGTVRGAILKSTRMINEMRANHELGILETLVLGHAYIAVALMSVNLKGNDHISLKIDCSGPIKGLVADANIFGEVRGYLKSIPIPINKPLDNFNLSPFFEAGFLSVTTHLKGTSQPFTGQVALQYGSIAQDLAYYYLQSEQIPTAFNLSINFDSEGHVTGAGGLFLQSMPDASEDVISGLENLVLGLPSLGASFAKGKGPVELINDAFTEFSPKFLDNHRIEFMCHCNHNKIQHILAMLPLQDLENMIEEGPFPVEIRCPNCNSNYLFTESDLRQIYENHSRGRL